MNIGKPPSETVRVTCPHCRRTYDLTREVIAKKPKAQCGRCRHSFDLTGPTQELLARAAAARPAGTRRASPSLAPPAEAPVVRARAATLPPESAPVRAHAPHAPHAPLAPPAEAPASVPAPLAETAPEPAPLAAPAAPRPPPDLDALPFSSMGAAEAGAPLFAEPPTNGRRGGGPLGSPRAALLDSELAALAASAAVVPVGIAPRPRWLDFVDELLAHDPRVS